MLITPTLSSNIIGLKQNRFKVGKGNTNEIDCFILLKMGFQRSN